MPAISRKDLFNYASTDTKPTLNIPAHSVLIESDTGDVYQFDGTTWREIGTAGAVHTYEQSVPGSERNSSSAQEGWQNVLSEVRPVVLTALTATTIGGGVADDTLLMGLIIILNATAVTATVAGFENEGATAKSIIFTGATATDTVISFGSKGLRNTKGALTVTPSIADKVIVLYKAR